MHPTDLIARNALWNLLSMLIPLGVAIVSMPMLIQGLGAERFGILALIWIILGYVSVIDLGVGRALTKLVAEKLGNGRDSEIPVLAWTGLLLVAVFGIFSGAVVALLAPWLVSQALSIPGPLQPETLQSVYLLAFSVPIITVTAGLRGILEAKQQFGVISILRLALGISMYASPLLALAMDGNLFVVTAILVIVRIVLGVAHLSVCLNRIPDLKAKLVVSASMVRPLLGLGGWMTVSNVVGPLMVYFDRFFIASAISAIAVAYYTTPYELVTKLLVVSGAISGVLFPVFSSSYMQNMQHCFEAYKRGVKYVALLLFPVVLALIFLANELLSWWINPEFAQNGAMVLKLIAIGVYMNSLAQIPFSLIQGAGRPDLTAKFHAAQLPFYAVALWWLANNYGIEGVAMAWTLRACVDAVVCFAAADRMFQERSQKIKFWPIFMLTSIVIFMAAAFFSPLEQIKSAVLLISIPALLLLSWFYVLDKTEKAFLIAAQKKILGSNKAKLV